MKIYRLGHRLLQNDDSYNSQFPIQLSITNYFIQTQKGAIDIYFFLSLINESKRQNKKNFFQSLTNDRRVPNNQTKLFLNG